MVNSKIFVQNRALGYVSNHIPLITRYIQRRKENLIVTCVGKEFHTYGCAHFTLLSVSGTHPEDISCLSADSYHVYTAAGNIVYAWRRGTELKHTYKGHNATVHIILPFGPHILTVDENSTVIVWDIKTESLILELNFSNVIFEITTLIHPVTYINKVLFGSQQGSLQLWNLKKNKMIYTFKRWNKPITALEQAPAINVVAIGLSDGKIILYNLKLDETIFELIQDSGTVTSITFRTDDIPIMATGSLKGAIVLWNLEHRKVESLLLKAHFASVTGLKFLPNEPLLVSSSPDNSLKLWIFDLVDGGGRILKMREGHAEPPTIVRFYGNNSDNILSAGGDSSLRIFSTITETFNKSLGRASYNRKASKKKSKSVEDPLLMPPIVYFSVETTREKEWCNIAAIHSGLGMVTTWSYNSLKMGEHKLLPERFRNNRNATATSLCLTKCGNFVVIGYSTGYVDKFNIQSGIHRMIFNNDEPRHIGPVTGVIVDALNQVLITAGKDCCIKFWAFNPVVDIGLKITRVHEPIEWLRYHSECNFIAAALEDFSIILIDLDTKNAIRHFHGHKGKLTDATFSPDTKWLITSSMDCTIRTWDIVSSHLIDVFQVSNACISLHFSPTGEFLATSHMCNKGIYLWSNRTIYSYTSLKAIKEEDVVPMLNLPNSMEETNQENNDDLNEEEPEYVSPEQLNENLITISTLAQSRWKNLLVIDTIKKRNKPKESLQASETAPFFLPTILSSEIKFDLPDIKNPINIPRLQTQKDFQNLTIFGKLLYSTSTTDGNFIDVINKLKSMSPSSIDFEIQSLSAKEDSTELLLLQFMKVICYMMKRKIDFELAQSYLAVFLKWHSKTISETRVLIDKLEDLQDLQLKNWQLLREKLFYNLSIVKALKKM
ncbi:hypothetical protein M0802_006574 [Mischocyttarus mexicanus]|nr:hypothetical protein M0802_006574 [Mischocyttarus mexicanus]